MSIDSFSSSSRIFLVRASGISQRRTPRPYPRQREVSSLSIALVVLSHSSCPCPSPRRPHVFSSPARSALRPSLRDVSIFPASFVSLTDRRPTHDRSIQVRLQTCKCDGEKEREKTSSRRRRRPVPEVSGADAEHR